MTLAAKKPLLATAADLLAIPEHQRFHEIIDGEIVQKAMPSLRHGSAQRKLSALVDPYGRRRGGPGRPGGWLFATEVEIEFEPHQVYRPDVAGWQRERLADIPDEAPLRVLPGWVCEILSRSNTRHDLITKKRVYHRCGVPHYWILDPSEGTLSVYRWTKEGYLEVLLAQRGERVRAEPFDAVEMNLGVLFDDEEDE